jgi:hypothetical protein
MLILSFVLKRKLCLFAYHLENKLAEELFKVYVRTLDHPHVLEMIVSAPDKATASESALKHVKATNPEKGRPLEESQKNSTVLSVKKVGKNGCIVTGKISTVVVDDLAKNYKAPKKPKK